MKCLRCLNENPDYFYEDQGRWYCRRCLDFGRLEAGTLPPTPRLTRSVLNVQPHLEFELLPFQKDVSSKTLDILKSGTDVLIYAVCGGGKTELVLASIAHYLSQGKKVCFAISRRQVVLELAGRLAKNFPTLKVVPVCQGFTEITDGDLIVCTTHQLYRYSFCFDLLILDELDAFPYAGNPVLEAIAMQSCIGQKIFLSATPDQHCMKLIEQRKMEMVTLFKRPHQKPLCIPKVFYLSKTGMFLMTILALLRFRLKNKQVLLFVPRIRDAMWMKRVLRHLFKAEAITSKSEDKEKIMADFHARKSRVLICTTVFERGITVPSVQVIVYHADHPVFTEASLIQIFGRVGRSFSDPYGESLAFCLSPSRALNSCIRQLRHMNAVSGVQKKSGGIFRSKKS